MIKKTADKLIYEYRDKIFGFAMEKTRNVDQANELASDIICEVYRSFLRIENIVNLDGYVYRIARNVWARYVRGLAESRSFEDIDNVVIPYYDRHYEDDEMLEALRREIGFLTDRQRNVIYLHYYCGLSVNDIAKRLKISSGTVKWHLSDARTKLKEGITMTINEQNLSISPIRFADMGHCGNAGSTGDTNDMFDTRLKQNIAYACYRQPRTLEEIAREVGVPQVYVADELARLVDYAYIDRLDNSKNPKYRTNMLITDNHGTQLDDLMDNAAEHLCGYFFPEVFREFEADPAYWGFQSADGDVNYMMYTLLMSSMVILNDLFEDTDYYKYSVKRPDGGNFIALANAVSDDAPPFETRYPYWTCGYMYRKAGRGETDGRAFEAISVDCAYTDREQGWRDNLTSDWEALVKFIDNGKDSLTQDEYKRLCDKGYVHNDTVTPVIFKESLAERGKFFGEFQRFIEKKITITDELRAFAKKFDSDIYERIKGDYPEHMRPAAQSIFSINQLGAAQLIPRCVEKMLANGALKPLTDVQRKSAFSVLCICED